MTKKKTIITKDPKRPFMQTSTNMYRYRHRYLYKYMCVCIYIKIKLRSKLKQYAKPRIRRQKCRSKMKGVSALRAKKKNLFREEAGNARARR